MDIFRLRDALQNLQRDPMFGGTQWRPFRAELNSYIELLGQSSKLSPALRAKLIELLSGYSEAHRRLIALLTESGYTSLARRIAKAPVPKSAEAPSGFRTVIGRNPATGAEIKITVSRKAVAGVRTAAKPTRAAPPVQTPVPEAPTSRGTQRSAPRQPRWILAQVFDLPANKRKKPTPFFLAGAEHEVRVIIGAAQNDWLVAAGGDESESIDAKLPKGTHELTVVFFMPALGVHATGKLTLPPSGPTPKPATFRFTAGAAGSEIQALISIVYRGRVLQTALLSGTAVADPVMALDSAKISLRLQVVVPGFADLNQREPYDATLVAATGPDNTAVTAGVVQPAEGIGKTVAFDLPRIVGAARSIRNILEDAVTDESMKGKLDSAPGRDLLWKLAQQGRLLYECIGERLEKELPGRDLSRIQLVQADPQAFIPIEFAYALPTPANDAALCKNWKGALAGKPCTAAHHELDELDHLKVVCPSGFWGISKIIERQNLEDQKSEEIGKSDFGVRAEPNAKRPALPPIGAALFAWSEKLDATVAGTSAGVLKSLNQATQKQAAAATTWKEWVTAIGVQRPGLLVLLSHTTSEDALEIGPEESGDKATVAQINRKFVKTSDGDAPIVFLLGCTTGVADDKLFSFVGRFRHEGAALVVGTITPVLGERAASVVKAVVAKLAEKRPQPVRFGELMRDARRELLAGGELTALCATSFGDASWLVN